MRDDLIDRLADSLDRLERRLGREWGPLTKSQWALLNRLRKGPVPVGTLAERLRISTAGTTRMLDKLEALGYVVRQRHADDLRQVSAALTESGQRAVDAARAVYTERLRELTAPLSDARLAEWLEILDAVAPPRGQRP
jgi:DNA-binding MarR family transcriptional regulator